MNRIILDINDWDRIAKKAYGIIPVFSRQNYDKEFDYTIGYEVKTDKIDDYATYTQSIMVYLDFADHNEELLFRLKYL